MTVDEEIRVHIEAFANELAELVKQTTVAAVHEALADATLIPRPVAKPSPDLMPQPPPYVLPPAPLRSSNGAAIPLSVEAYERAAYQRALAECGGDLLAAAKLLGVGKSTMYRRVRSLGVEDGAEGVIITDEPVSLEGYERLAYQRALDEAGGDAQAAANLLGVGKSTMYRAVAKYGLG